MPDNGRDARHGQRTGYGSRRLQTASDCAHALRFGLRGLALRGLALVLGRLPTLIGYLSTLPRTQVRLSEDPAGKLIAEHLSLKRCGIPRFRLAQGVLYLPSDFS